MLLYPWLSISWMINVLLIVNLIYLQHNCSFFRLYQTKYQFDWRYCNLAWADFFYLALHIWHVYACPTVVKGSDHVFVQSFLTSSPYTHFFSVSSLGVTPATGGTCTMAHHSTEDTATPPRCRTQTCMPLHMVRTRSMAATSSWWARYELERLSPFRPLRRETRFWSGEHSSVKWEGGYSLIGCPKKWARYVAERMVWCL